MRQENRSSDGIGLFVQVGRQERDLARCSATNGIVKEDCGAA